MSTPISSKSRTAAIALLVAAVALLVGMMSKRWFSADRGDGGVGLTGIEECRHDMCQSASWGDIGDEVPGDLKASGYLGFAFGLIGALGCAALGGMMLAGRGRRAAELKAPKFIGAALTLGALGQMFFVNRLMDKGLMGKMGISYGLVLGVGAAVAAAIILKVMVSPALAAELQASPAPAPPPQPYTIA